MSFDEEDDSELNCTLWVGNLDVQVNENTLLELFSQFQVGPIEKIHIPKGKDGTGHKGYCFVQFQHDESVPYTMNVMEGTGLYGKILRLQPRPGSKHRKLMDQRENEQRQLLLAQQQQQQPQQQWFVTPQMGQFQGMLVYPNHPAMFQPYAAAAGLPGVGVTNGMPLQFSHGMGLPMIQIPVQQPPPSHEVQHIRVPRNPDFRQPRPPRAPMTNGYTNSSNGVHRPPGGGGTAQPSHYNSQSQVLNGSQSRFSHTSATRGTRPSNPHRPPHSHYLQNGPRNANGNNNNGNGRLPFTPRAAPTNYPQAPQIYASPMYQQPFTPVQYQHDPQQFFRRGHQGQQVHVHPNPHSHPGGGAVPFPSSAAGANMYQQQPQY